MNGGFGAKIVGSGAMVLVAIRAKLRSPGSDRGFVAKIGVTGVQNWGKD